MKRQYRTVAAPPPLPPRLSIVTMARLPEDTGWEGGLQFRPVCPSASGLAALSDAAKPDPERPDTVRHVPTLVVAASDCDDPATPMEEHRERALAALLACEPSQIEAELWDGGIARAHNDANPGDAWPNRWLAHEDTTDLGSGDPTEALACLERSLADCGCGQRGMVHATTDTVTWWARENLVRREGGTLLTVNDTLVVPGTGYPGTDPSGDVPASGAWAYATHVVTVRRGAPRVVPDTLAEALDRRTNTAEFRAERLAAATWDGCCAFGVHVQFDSCAAAS